MEHIVDIEDLLRKTKESKPFLAAQYAFVVAMLAKKQGKNDKAIEYARECIALIPEALSEADIATSFVELNGILLPDHLTEGMVRQKMLPIEF